MLGEDRRVLRHDQDAEDVFQATFLILTRQAESRRWAEAASVLWAVMDVELQRRPDRLPEPLVLSYLVGKARDHAARQLGWSQRTLERRLSQGLTLLRGTGWARRATRGPRGC